MCVWCNASNGREGAHSRSVVIDSKWHCPDVVVVTVLTTVVVMGDRKYSVDEFLKSAGTFKDALFAGKIPCVSRAKNQIILYYSCL